MAGDVVLDITGLARTRLDLDERDAEITRLEGIIRCLREEKVGLQDEINRLTTAWIRAQARIAELDLALRTHAPEFEL